MCTATGPGAARPGSFSPTVPAVALGIANIGAARIVRHPVRRGAAAGHRDARIEVLFRGPMLHRPALVEIRDIGMAGPAGKSLVAIPRVALSDPRPRPGRGTRAL